MGNQSGALDVICKYMRHDALMASSRYPCIFLYSSGNDGPQEQLKKWVGCLDKREGGFTHCGAFVHLHLVKAKQNEDPTALVIHSQEGLWFHLQVEIKDIWQRAVGGILNTWKQREGWNHTVDPCENLSSPPQPILARFAHLVDIRATQVWGTQISHFSNGYSAASLRGSVTIHWVSCDLQENIVMRRQPPLAQGQWGSF
jgi:hypothetical protein